MDLHRKIAQIFKLTGLPAAGSELLAGFDIDGTLVCHDLSPSPGVLKAILDLAKTGTHLVLSTGRGISGLWGALDSFDLELTEMGLDPKANPLRHGYAVLQNGALVVHLDPDIPAGYEIIDLHLFDAKQILDRLQQAVPEAIFGVEPLSGSRLVSAPFPAGELWGEYQVVPLEELVSKPISRLTLRAPQLSAEQIANRMAQAGLQGVEYAIGWSAWMDVSPPGVSKATGLAKICEILGIRAATNTLVVGDGSNDIDMLEWAACAVAMGQSQHAVQAAAQVTTTSVQEGGVAQLISALLEWNPTENG